MKSIEAWKAELSAASAGLLRMHEGDSSFRVFALPPGSRPVEVLRALGHVRPAKVGGFERALRAEVGSTAPLREQAEGFLALTQRLDEVTEVELAASYGKNYDNRALTLNWRSPVALLGRIGARFVALVPPEFAEMQNLDFRPKRLATAAVEDDADAAAHALMTQLAAHAPQLVAAHGSGGVSWWGIRSGASVDEALERALFAHGVLRVAEAPFAGYADESDDAPSPYTRYEPLNALLLSLQARTTYLYGWSGKYDELTIATTLEGFVVGVAADVSWT